MQVRVGMSKSVWVQVWLDLPGTNYNDETIEETAGDVYIAAIRRANDYPPDASHSSIELETISTDYVEVEHE